MAKASKKGAGRKPTTKQAAAKKAAKAAPVQKATGQEAAEPHVAREQLPIPDAKYVGLTTFDAKDPNTK